MRKVSLIGNSLAYLLCQKAKRPPDWRPGMTPEDVRAVSNRMPDIRDIGTIPIAHTTALPHKRSVTNSLAYLLCQEAKRATDYRPRMTPEDVRVVSMGLGDPSSQYQAGVIPGSRLELLKEIAPGVKRAAA